METYTETTEESPKDSGDDVLKGFPLSAFCWIPLQAPTLTQPCPQRFSPAKVLATNENK